MTQKKETSTLPLSITYAILFVFCFFLFLSAFPELEYLLYPRCF